MEEARLGRWNTIVPAWNFIFSPVEMEEARLGRWNNTYTK